MPCYVHPRGSGIGSEVADEKDGFLGLDARGCARNGDRCLLKSFPAPGTAPPSPVHHHWVELGVGSGRENPGWLLFFSHGTQGRKGVLLELHLKGASGPWTEGM